MGIEQTAAAVRDVMSPDALRVHASDTIGRARDLSARAGAHALPVEENGRIVGILTTTDLVDNWRDDRRVDTVMTRHPHRVKGDVPVADAARLMLERRVHHLVVDEPDGDVGILSSFDLLEVIASRPDDGTSLDRPGREPTSKP